MHRFKWRLFSHFNQVQNSLFNDPGTNYPCWSVTKLQFSGVREQSIQSHPWLPFPSTLKGLASDLAFALHQHMHLSVGFTSRDWKITSFGRGQEGTDNNDVHTRVNTWKARPSNGGKELREFQGQEGDDRDDTTPTTPAHPQHEHRMEGESWLCAPGAVKGDTCWKKDITSNRETESKRCTVQQGDRRH